MARVPKQTYTGLGYGKNQQINEQQSAAPLSQPSPARIPTTSNHRQQLEAKITRGAPLSSREREYARFYGLNGPVAPRGPRTDLPGGDGMFAPTDRPEEPMTAGVDVGPGPGAPPQDILPEDPYLFLRAAFAVNPTPALAALLARAGE